MKWLVSWVFRTRYKQCEICINHMPNQLYKIKVVIHTHTFFFYFQTCKVADFGFAKDVMANNIYERKSEGKLPIR